MSREAVPSSSALAILLDGSPAEQRQWFNAALASLTPELLVEIEARTYAAIEARYPNNPWSLFNLRYLEGQQKIRRLRPLFDQALERLAARLISHVEDVRELTLAHHLGLLSDAFESQRRPARLQREADALSYAVRSGLAYDTALQRQLYLDPLERLDALERARIDEDRALRSERSMLAIDQARAHLEQPFQLQLKLLDLLAEVTRFRMALADQAARNPTLTERLRETSEGLGRIAEAAHDALAKLNQQGPYAPTPEQRHDQAAQTLAILMEEFARWRNQNL